MTPFSTKKRRARALLAAVALVIALPASTIGKQPQGYNTDSDPYVAFTAAVPAGGKIVPLINSGENPFGDEVFEGLPDGLGVVPGPRGSG
ncbi:MAG: hypothetical protein OEW24_07700, partial [Chloroflexota bacterium]|nr:hypothetical protein [Chloroflexota bacterium]